jgi:hypothetical protein
LEEDPDCVCRIGYSVGSFLLLLQILLLLWVGVRLPMNGSWLFDCGVVRFITLTHLAGVVAFPLVIWPSRALLCCQSNFLLLLFLFFFQKVKKKKKIKNIFFLLQKVEQLKKFSYFISFIFFEKKKLPGMRSTRHHQRGVNGFAALSSFSLSLLSLPGCLGLVYS